MNNQQEMNGNPFDLGNPDPLCNDSDELLRQLSENPFELDTFFTDFSTADIKVSNEIPQFPLALLIISKFSHFRRRTTMTFNQTQITRIKIS